MSLYTTALARQTYSILRKGAFERQLKLVPAAKWVGTSACSKAPETLNPNEGFWDKNKRLNRPMSPHLTIYKPQITSMLSITHRGTGLGMSAAMYGFGIGMLLLPGNYPHYLQLLEQAHWGAACIFSLKFIIAWPFMFHFANGLRHLAWDLGKGFQISQVYATGWTVLGLGTVLALIAAAL